MAPSPARERGFGGEGFAGLCLAATLACAPSPPPSATPVAPPPFLIGSFEDDYQNQFEISASSWRQVPHGWFHVIKWVPEGSYLIAQNDSANTHAPGLWTRIDWVKLEGLPPWEWAFCLSAYEAPTADSAEATEVVRPDTPINGCNGYPYSRMKRVAAPTEAMLDQCRERYRAAGSDGPILLAVDSVIVDPVALPPLRCGHLRAQHPRIKDAE